MNWTPGPWHVEKSLGRFEVWPVDNGQTHTHVGVAQKESDARLISLAPELAEALKVIAEEANTICGANNREAATIEGWQDKARVLLAKLEA